MLVRGNKISRPSTGWRTVGLSLPSRYRWLVRNSWWRYVKRSMRCVVGAKRMSWRMKNWCVCGESEREVVVWMWWRKGSSGRPWNLKLVREKNSRWAWKILESHGSGRQIQAGTGILQKAIYVRKRTCNLSPEDTCRIYKAPSTTCNIHHPSFHSAYLHRDAHEALAQEPSHYVSSGLDKCPAPLNSTAHTQIWVSDW